MDVWNLLHRLHEPVAWLSTLLTISLNGLLFYFITFKTKHDFGIYKRILKFLTIFNIVYSTMQSVTLPILFASDYYFILMPTGYLLRFFGKHGQTILGCFNASCFGTNNAVLAVHFAYRYIQICHFRRGYLLTGYYQLIWLGYMLLCLTVWMLACITFLGPSLEKERLLIPDVLKAFDINMENKGYVGPQYWVHRGKDLELQAKDCFGMVVVSTMTSSALLMMCICGYKTYHGMVNVVASAKTKRLQKQLFVSLVILTTVPLGAIYCPLMALFVGPVIGFGMGRFGLVYHYFLTIPPFFDPLVLMYFIADYRRAAVDILRRLGLGFLFPQLRRIEPTASSTYLASTAANSQRRPSSVTNLSQKI